MRLLVMMQGLDESDLSLYLSAVFCCFDVPVKCDEKVVICQKWKAGEKSCANDFRWEL